jgi:hypothetical protein
VEFTRDIPIGGAFRRVFEASRGYKLEHRPYSHSIYITTADGLAVEADQTNATWEPDGGIQPDAAAGSPGRKSRKRQG